jgi:hypothetical protein
MEKRNKRRKKRNILNFTTWYIQGISYKEDQLDDILAKKSIKIADISESKRKLKDQRKQTTIFKFTLELKHKSISKAIKKRKWKWIGHTLRKPHSDITKAALK